VALLSDPYRDLFTAQDQTLLAQLVGGNANLPMGRSRFISDQVYGKALFGGPNIMGVGGPITDESSLDRPEYAKSWDTDHPARGPYKLRYISSATTNNRPDHNDDETEGFDQTVVPRTRDATVKAHIEEVPIHAELKDILRVLGQLRFNTVFVRNLFFITNLYRVLRHKMHEDLTYSNAPVVKGNNLARWRNTEYRGYQTYDSPAWKNLD